MVHVQTWLIEEMDKPPTKADIAKCIRIAETNNCIVRLEWVMEWSGWYHIIIHKDDDVEEMYDRLPKIYPV